MRVKSESWQSHCHFGEHQLTADTQRSDRSDADGTSTIGVVNQSTSEVTLPMKRLIWLPIAGFLLIAGAAVAAAAPSLVDQARGVLGTGAQDDSGTVAVGNARLVHPGQDLFAEVLADLVSNGTITQAQSDAITQGLSDKVDALRAEMESRRTLIEGIVEDGVITQDEINQLPGDDPLRVAFDSIADDGQITLDQLRGLGPGFGPGHRGRGPGGFMWFGPEATTDS